MSTAIALAVRSLYRRLNYHHFIDEEMEAERLQVICPKLYIKLMKVNRVKGTVLKVKWETVKLLTEYGGWRPKPGVIIYCSIDLPN